MLDRRACLIGCRSGKGPFTPSVSVNAAMTDDASDSVLIENNGVTQKWVAALF